MRIRNTRVQDEPEINLVPLIDVMLVLIIFFAITTHFDTDSTLQLQLPSAQSRNESLPKQPLHVLINAEGRYFVDQHEVLRTDSDALKQALEQAAGEDRQRTVLLRADAHTQHQAVVTVLDVLGQLGFARISIATAPEDAKREPVQ